MESKVIIERQYKEEAERHGEIRELVTRYEDPFLTIAQSIIQGRDMERTVGGLVSDGWRRLEAVSFVDSINEDIRGVIDALGEGRPHGDIVDDLIERDWSPQAAVDAVTSLDELIASTRDALAREERARTYESKRRARAAIGFSALFVVVGLSIGLLSSTTTTGGSAHAVGWGAALLGLVGLVAGLVRLTSAYQR